MGILNPTFILGLILLLYLTSFVVFAIIRIATGVSIQRIGYFSLRRIAYTPRDGIRIDIRSLGLQLHRPTFAQPTWISLRLKELKVTLDVNALSTTSGRGSEGTVQKEDLVETVNGGPHTPSVSPKSPKPILRPPQSDNNRSRAWKRLTLLKEKIKRLHGRIGWLRLVDVVALNSSCVVSEIGALEIGTFSMAVDTRRKTVDRGRLFQHKKFPAGDQRPAEWMFNIRSVLFTPEGKESLEVIDNCSLNIHGLLYRDLAGLRDASISLKLGRIHIPYDDLKTCQTRVEGFRKAYAARKNEYEEQEADISISDVIEELDRPGSREAKIVQTVSDSKEFISSILRGIQEIQMAISFVGMSKKVHSVQPTGSPMYLNVTMNEFGIDMHRLDPKSPAHRMYFLSKDIAHQALLAAISIGVSLDDGSGKPERFLYIPMVTTTIKTTLPSKTVSFSEDNNAAERNANILFSNLVITSPSIDVDPKHMALVFALIQNRSPRSSRSLATKGSQHHLLSRLLPKANIKVSIHEPVVRVVLPPADPALKNTDEYDLLISSISSISLDVDSSHSSAGELHYALMSNLRVASHQFYYHTASGDRHNLMLMDALELKIQVNASPDVRVIATGNIQALSVHMIRPEISTGVRQIVQQLSKKPEVPPRLPQRTLGNPNFLRPLPPWLVHFQFQGSNFGLEVAGVDTDVSSDPRGVALRLESWTADYRVQKSAGLERPSSRRSWRNKSEVTDVPSIAVTPPSPSVISATPPPDPTDGRRLAVHVRGFEAFVVEGEDTVEPESFVSLPRFEVAFSTSSDTRGPIFHVNSHVNALYLHYSLYRYYAIGVAAKVLRNAFIDSKELDSRSNNNGESSTFEYPDVATSSQRKVAQELMTVDVRSGLVQVKATMPSDPPLMLQIYSMEGGCHRWSIPFLRSGLIRLYARAPQIKSAWARIMSTKNIRIDLRESHRKHGRNVIDENSIDIVAEFIRLAIPHQLVPHKIFDNIANVIKATEQLHHRFKTGTNEYVLRKRPEPPKKVPRISIRSKALLFDLEDGPFDWKLGTIYRAGLIEAKQRLAREEAFLAKKKNLEELRHPRGSSRYRAQSTHPPQRHRSDWSLPEDSRRRSTSAESHQRRRSPSPQESRARRMRYNPEGTCRLSGAAKISCDEALDRLQRYNAQSWKKRIDGAYLHQNIGMREIRGIFWGNDDVQNTDSSENILAMPDRPGLMSTLVSDLSVVIDKPSFPIQDYPHFLHRIGKGMPHDMEYTLLIPVGLQIDMGEARMTLRDYPLPLLHVPAIRPGQSPRLPSWSLRTDFVIAEEYRGHVSTKDVKVQVIPPEKITNPKITRGFAIDVRRTVSPVKTYSDVDVAINTSAPTSIAWGTSYQPAIQEMMMIVEGFTKPKVDPSDRCGFWDKIRLNVHSRVNVIWKGDGDVHLKLKGARDPYVVTGYGAGFVMCWRNGVRWGIHQNDDPREFMTVSSGEYVLAIPDYSHQARGTSVTSGQDSESISSTGSYRNSAMFKKVIMKLSGNVRWRAGIVFERNVDHGKRSFEFIPHYQVTLRTPERAKTSEGQVYDAFRGFRSNHIHLSLAVAAPLDRDWAATNIKPSTSYNAVHLSPRFFTHFFNWWSMFSGVMSLPVRQGKLFPGIEKSSKKFGRHLATFKYNLLLSPLFIAHVYKHKDAEDYSEDLVSATGLKLRLDRFILDLHQRREEFAAQGKGRAKHIKTSGMRINQAQLDFVSADIRAVSAKIAGTTSEDVRTATDDDLVSYQEPPAAVDMSRFTIPDNDFSWIDMDDFVELDWILPAETNPETKIMPLAFAPRFTYFRQTDHPGASSQDSNRSSPFGNEPTHYCVMSEDNDPRRVQCELLKERLAVIDEQLEAHRRTLGEQKLRVIRDSYRDGSLKDRYEMLSEQGRRLERKKLFLHSMHQRLSQRVDAHTSWRTTEGNTANRDLEEDEFQDDNVGLETQGIDTAPLSSFADDFSNRFIIHNAQIKWSNSLRNIILRYVHQVSQRRGFIYYMSRTAVKFILDIVEEQSKNKQKRADSSERPTPSDTPHLASTANEEHGGFGVEDRIQELLNDGKRFVDADDPAQAEGPRSSSIGNLEKDISQDFTPLNSYHVRMVAPQIQLQSERNAKSVLLVTAKSMQLKVIQIMDKDRIADDVSGLVQRRFSVDMDSVQFFVTNQKTLMQFLNLYSGNRYGTPKGSAWPPWVPYEVNFDFELNPFGFSRVVQRTSASLRYDKYNTLRLKYNDEVTSGKHGETHKPENMESRIDHLWIDFPQLRAVCDSTQYYTLYMVVLDLLMYSEPLEKVRSERLEKIMLASDFSDLSGAPQMVISLQERIRQLQEIRTHFQIHAKYLDRQGWLDRLSIERDLTSSEDELFFMMKAITTSQRKNDDRTTPSQSNALLRWYFSASEIVWHLMREKTEPLMEIQLRNATYDRTDNSDGSNHNTMEIERLHGLNLLPNALYPQMLAPYFENGKHFVGDQNPKMLSIKWHMLEAIAGIPVLDQFEVNLFPLKIQLELEIGQKLFEYIFPGQSQKDGGKGGFSPFMIKHRAHDEKHEEDADNEEQYSASDTTLPDEYVSSDDQGSATRAGSLEMRLRPTRAFPEAPAHRHGATGTNGEPHHFRLFQHNNRSHSASRLQSSRPQSIRTPSATLSRENLRANGRGSHEASSTNLSAMNGNEKSKRFGLSRSTSKDKMPDKDKPSDDLTEMITRASSFMTLAYVKIPSVVLCLSYKGKGDRNIEDVHNFVFRMPVLEYRNKTWSNLDLALRLKKDVIRALISHTGAIIGNKFSKQRPTKNQASRLRELANSSSMLPNSNNLMNPLTRDSSTLGYPSSNERGRSLTWGDSAMDSGGLERVDSFASSSAQSSIVTTSAYSAEPSTIAEPDAGADDHNHETFRRSLMRRFTHDSQRTQSREGSVDDPEESTRKKRALLLGKKFVDSLK